MSKIDEAIEKLEDADEGCCVLCLTGEVVPLLKEAKEENKRLLDIIENYGSQLGRLGVTCQSKKKK